MTAFFLITRSIGILPYVFLLFVVSSTTTQAQVTLKASDEAADDQFGFSVSQSGTIGLVGANTKNSGQGAAYLFRGLGTAIGTVTQNVKLIASDAAGSDQFGRSVSQSGTIGLVGAGGKNSFQGGAYVFRGLDTASGTVTENVKLTASDAALNLNNAFGWSVSQSGTIGLIGAFGNNGIYSQQGAAYVFRNLDTANGTVTQNVKLTASDATVNDNFGLSVSQSGTISLVASVQKNSQQGAAYVFRGMDTATGTVTENVKLIASDAAGGDRFGTSVILSGNTALVSAPSKNTFRGAAYVFRELDLATGTVMENVKLVASDAADHDGFGSSVSLSCNTGLIGVSGTNTSRGAAYLFRNLDTATGTVTENLKLIPTNAATGISFGNSVSLSGDQFTIGAFGYDSGVGKAFTGTVSSMTTLDVGSTSKSIDFISFISRDNWIIGQNSSANQVTLNAGNTANVTASGKEVYIGQNSGSNNNTLTISGTLTASQINVGAIGNTGNVLNVNTGGNIAANVIKVNASGTLAGSGSLTGTTTVASNGTIRGGTGTSIGTLTTGDVTVQSGGNLFANLGAGGTSSKLSLGDNTLDLRTGSILKLANVSGYDVTAGATWIIAQLNNGTALQLDGISRADGFQFGKYVQGIGNTGSVQIDVSGLPTLSAGQEAILTRSGNTLQITISPVPEPAALFGFAAVMLGVGAVIRKKFSTPVTAAQAVTPSRIFCQSKRPG